MHAGWFFGFFAVSGFCSLIYEVVWLRLAMAEFGVTTPMVSLVLSLFMAGLGIGSVLSGRLSARQSSRIAGRPGAALRTYALAEGMIGLSSVLVPLGFVAGSGLLSRLGTSWGSGTHYFLSGIVLALTMLPFGVCMGATFPLAMSAMRRLYGAAAQRSFSYLYLANLIGATSGTLGSAFVLIELLGFRGTLLVAGALNLGLCAAAFLWSRRLDTEAGAELAAAASEQAPELEDATERRWAGIGLFWLLLTGLCSMAMEVVWTRLYVPYLGTLVYAFAGILAIYLATTFLGSQLYRSWAKRRASADGTLWLFVVALLGLLSLLPLLASDPTMRRPGFVGGLRQLLFGVGPFCAALGFLTPFLVDRYAAGRAQRAGSAYAVNVVGCILGPLLAGFVLLPQLSERVAILALSLPLFLGALYTIATEPGGRRAGRLAALVLCLATVLPAAWLAKSTHSAIEAIPAPKLERRDYTATTVAWGLGMGKRLNVNGIGMTSLTPITKMMVHLPLSLHRTPPQSALVICFGMGTTYRSALSWGIQATAVELVPSIPSLIGFFHADGEAVLRAPNGRVVIDDGRRFLSREGQSFDVMVIDPPPPVEAAGSSLLYTTEMYEAVRRRLSAGGILQQWFPTDDAAIVSAVASALKQSFPYVYAFHSIEGWGYHFLASAEPITFDAPAELVKRMPPAALRDLIEWGPFRTPEQMLASVLNRPASLDALIKRAPIQTLRDDRPVNEYYLLRRGRF